MPGALGPGRVDLGVFGRSVFENKGSTETAEAAARSRVAIHMTSASVPARVFHTALIFNCLLDLSARMHRVQWKARTACPAGSPRRAVEVPRFARRLKSSATCARLRLVPHHSRLSRRSCAAVNVRTSPSTRLAAELALRALVAQPVAQLQALGLVPGRASTSAIVRPAGSLWAAYAPVRRSLRRRQLSTFSSSFSFLKLGAGSARGRPRTTPATATHVRATTTTSRPRRRRPRPRPPRRRSPQARSQAPSRRCSARLARGRPRPRRS